MTPLGEVARRVLQEIAEKRLKERTVNHTQEKPE